MFDWCGSQGTLYQIRPLITLRSWKWGLNDLVKVTFTRPLQNLFSWKGLVKVTYNSPFLNLKGSISKTVKGLICFRIYCYYKAAHCIPDLGEVPMEAAILAHVHPLAPRGWTSTTFAHCNLLTLYSLLHMIALEIHCQLI